MKEEMERRWGRIGQVVMGRKNKNKNKKNKNFFPEKGW